MDLNTQVTASFHLLVTHHYSACAPALEKPACAKDADDADGGPLRISEAAVQDGDAARPAADSRTNPSRRAK